MRRTGGHLHLHSTVVLLKLCSAGPSTININHLHSTVVLLKPFSYFITISDYLNLHSTVVLLKLT